MLDNYSHNINGIFYVEKNILGPQEQSQEYNNLIDEFNSMLAHNCECDIICKEYCFCIVLSGGINYRFTESNNLIINDHKDLNHPIVECNNLCRCSQGCGNRLIQNGPIQTLFVKPLEVVSKGLGLFTNGFIQKGTFICEYAGEVLTKAEVLRRHEYNQRHGRMNYIFCLKEHVNNRIIETFIDPSMFGNIGRYINHSCDPNCLIIPARVDTSIPALGIFSLRDILPNSEITIDYGSNNLANPTGENLTNKKVCLCKSNICRGYLPYDDY